MQDINFIPARYQQRRVRQVNWRWRTLVAFAFAALIAAGWWSQRARRAELTAAVEAARLNRETAEQQALLLASAEQSLAARTTAATLLVHLRRPWPRTNLVASVARLAPQDVRITELALSSVSLDESMPVARPVEPRGDEAQPPPPGAAGDLERLRGGGLSALVVRLQGESRAHAAMQQFLAALSTHDLIQAVELVNLEAHEGSHSSFRFQLRIHIVPPHGEPGSPGPTAPSQLHATVAGR